MNKTVKIEYTQQSKLTTAKTQVIFEGTSEELSESIIKDELVKQVSSIQDEAQKEASALTMKWSK